MFSRDPALCLRVASIRPSRLPVDSLRAVEAARSESTGKRLGRIGRDVVDESADGLRTEGDLARVLQNLDPVETLERGMEVRRVVAIRCEGQRQPVFEQQYFGRACRIETADADVGTQAEPFLVASEDARDLPQGLIDGEHPRVGQILFGQNMGAAGDPLEALAAAEHHDFGQLFSGGSRRLRDR